MSNLHDVSVNLKMSSSLIIKKRSKKTNFQQMEIIIQRLEENHIFTSGKCHPLQTLELENKWEELGAELNSVPNGARKTITQWKTFLIEWKSKTKKKVRAHKKNVIRTRGGGYRLLELTPLEQRLMSIIGWATAIGTDNLPEELDPQNQENTETDPRTPNFITNYDVDAQGFLIDIDKENENTECISENCSTSKLNEKELLTLSPKQSENITGGVKVLNTKKKNIPLRIKKGKVEKSKTRNYTSSSTQLERAAEMYVQGSMQAAAANQQMVASVVQLATALTTLSEALVTVWGKK